MKAKLTPLRVLTWVVAVGVVVWSTLAAGPPRAGAGSRLAAPATVGPFAFAVAVDKRAGRAFVVSASIDTTNASVNGLTGQGRVSVLDARTGALLRTVNVGPGSVTLAVDERAGHAFVANMGRIQWYHNADGTTADRAVNQSLSLLDTRTGHVLRTISLGGQVPFALAVDTRTSRVFVATGPLPPNTPGQSSNVRVLDTRTGALLRTVALHSIPPLASSQMAVDETTGRVFLVLSDIFRNPRARSTVRILDAGTGAVVRSVTVGRETTAMVVDQRTHHLFVTNGLRQMSFNTVQVMVNKINTVSMLDTRSGGVLRTLTQAQGLGCVAVDERTGHIFCFTGSNALHSGQMLMLDTRSGALLRTVPVGNPAALVVDATASRALVLNQGRLDSHGQLRGGATLSVLDTLSGAILRTVPLTLPPAFQGRPAFQGGPTLPPAVAVDEQTGRAFVLLVGDMLANRVRVLDTRSGALVRTVPLHPAPAARTP